MKKSHSLFYHIAIFALAQIAWLLLLGIWIYWYVSNYIIFEKVGDQLSPQIIYDGMNVLPFVGGIVLLVAISFGMSLTFRHLNVQIKLHNLYDNFIANVSHELKSPLSSLQLYLETLNSRDVPKEKQKEFFEHMINDTSRLKYLIDSILDISAMDYKGSKQEFQIVDATEEMGKIILDSVSQYKIDTSNFKLQNKLNEKCLCILDKNSFKIIFNNLINNAVKYTKPPLHLLIIIEKKSRRLIISITDNGVGIPPDETKKIFKKFYRLYDKDIPNVKGTGLGLFWVKEIIKMHRGYIFANSEGKNKGTTFRIELPVYDNIKSNELNKLLIRKKIV